MAEFLLAMDQGSTHSRTILFDRSGRAVSQAVIPLNTNRPRAGWAEHDPIAIWNSQRRSALKVLQGPHRGKMKIAGLGIANQRSTVILWDRESGRPLTSAISWQDLRAISMMHRWVRHREWVRSRTGLMLTPYYSAPKLCWLLDRDKGLRSRAEKGKVLCGTVNTYLIWHLTRGEVHATDYVNASRMLLMNLSDLSWDPALLSLFNIPPEMLPRLLPTVSDFGIARLAGLEIPIRASMGDQQAALLGLGAVKPGSGVINYGTGGFLLVNTGRRPVFLPGLLAGLAWATEREKAYVVEGTVNAVGTVWDWLCALGILKGPEEIDRLSYSTGGEIHFIPALAGLGAPHWLDKAGIGLSGLGPNTTKTDLIRAAVEGVAFLMKDIYEIIRKDRRLPAGMLCASGGGARISTLVQIQADWLGRSILRSDVREATARGAALMAGVGCGWWSSPLKIPTTRAGRIFKPRISKAERERLYRGWRRAMDHFQKSQKSR